MTSFRLAVAALILIPVLASAQRRSRGSTRADWDNLTSSSSGVKLSNKDVEKMNPVKLLIDKRKDLKLTDQQQEQLKGLDEKLKSDNEGLMNTLDSLRGETKISSSRPDDEDVARAAIARSAFVDLLARIRASYDSTLSRAIPMLDETQQGTATELLAKQREEAEETIREKVSSAGRRQPAPTTGRRRPLQLS